MKRNLFNLMYTVWDVFWIQIDFFISTWRSRFLIKFQGCCVGKGLKTSGPCFFKARKSGSIRIGKSVYLNASNRANRVGLSNPVLLETLDEGIIEIGDCSGGSSVVISARSKISIGNNVILGGNVRVFDHDFHSVDPSAWRTARDEQLVKSSPIKINDNVFIGTNAMILKGVTIGEGAVVGAGSVVTKDIGQNEIWAGNPARLICSKPAEPGAGHCKDLS